MLGLFLGSANLNARGLMQPLAGTFTGLCTAKLLHTSIKGWRQGTGIPYRTRKYQLNALAVIGGAFLTYWLSQKNNMVVPPATPAKVTPPAAQPAAQAAAAVPLTAEEAATIQAELDAGHFPLHKIQTLFQKNTLAHLLRHPGVIAQINTPRNDALGQTPLHRALAFKLSSGSGVPTLLITHPNIDLQVQDAEGNTPLHTAAGSLQINVQTDEDPVRLILEVYRRNNLTANQRNNKGDTWLHSAAYAGNARAIKLICWKQEYANLTDIHAQNNLGDTALIIACRQRNVYAVEALLSKGADPFLENNSQESVASIIRNSFGQARLLTEEERDFIRAAERAAPLTDDQRRLLADDEIARAEPSIIAAFESAKTHAAERDAAIAASIPEMVAPLRGIIGAYLGFGPTVANNNPTVTAPQVPTEEE